MTALFHNASHTSESILSHPITDGAEAKQDGSDVDPSTENRRYDTKSPKDEDAPSTLSPTLRRLPIAMPSPNLYTGISHLEGDLERESVVARSKSIQAEMPSVILDGLDETPATSNRQPPQDSAGTGVLESGTTETRSKEEDAKYLQTASNGDETCEKALKLSPSQLIELASTPSSLPRGTPPPNSSPSSGSNSSQALRSRESHLQSSSGVKRRPNAIIEKPGTETGSRNGVVIMSTNINRPKHRTLSSDNHILKSNIASYAVPPPNSVTSNAARNPTGSIFSPVSPRPAHVPHLSESPPPSICSPQDEIDTRLSTEESCPSPIPTSMPLPPFSLLTYLHLELSSNKPSPLYIHRSKASDIPFELSRVKIERLLNFLLLPPQLEQVLLFGTLACLDAFLYSFTILPLRFFKALSILAQSLGHNVAKESQYLTAFICSGAIRVWKRKRRDSINSNSGTYSKNERLHHLGGKSVPTASSLSSSVDTKARSSNHPHPESASAQGKTSGGTRTRFQSAPSTLLPEQKADLLKGFLLILSCTILTYFDASRMYHGIRGQAAIKLYVIYNVLEVSYTAGSPVPG